jgi:hypothetical protein
MASALPANLRLMGFRITRCATLDLLKVLDLRLNEESIRKSQRYHRGY